MPFSNVPSSSSPSFSIASSTAHAEVSPYSPESILNNWGRHATLYPDFSKIAKQRILEIIQSPETGQYLNLSQLNLLSLPPKAIMDLLKDKVVALNLADNKIFDISTLSEFVGLVKLNLSNNYINDISALSALSKVHSLDLSRNQVKDISLLHRLAQLTQLDLSNNEIYDIDSLEQLTQLKTLNLACTETSNLNALKELTQLTKLNLSHNALTTLTQLSGLKHLIYLNLSENKINDLTGLETLLELKYLDLEDNEIKNLTPLQSLKQLDTLTLTNNAIQNLTALQSLEKLHTLSLAQNEIRDLNPLSHLSTLELLDLSTNCLTDIRSLGSMPNLKKLYLYDNPFKILPEEMEHFTSLNRLSVNIHFLLFRPTHLPPNLEPSDLKEFQEKETFAAYVEKHHTQRLCLNSLEKIHALVKYVINHLTNKSNQWAIENSTFLNQLFYHVDSLVLPREQESDNFILTYEAKAWIKELRQQYMTMAMMSSIITQLEEAGVIDEDDHANGFLNTMLFISRDGLNVIYWNTESYQKVLFDLRQTKWDLLAYQRSSPQDEFVLANQESIITEIPFLNKYYQIYRKPFLEVQKRVDAVLSIFIEPGTPYFNAFHEALDAWNLDASLKLTDKENQEALDNLIASVLTPRENSGSSQTQLYTADIISEVHFTNLCHALDLPIPDHNNTREQKIQQASSLWVLGMLITKYSSKFIFGTDVDTPIALRRYASALLSSATLLAPEEFGSPHTNQLASLSPFFYRHINAAQSITYIQALSGNYCTDSLFHKMAKDVHELLNLKRDLNLRISEQAKQDYFFLSTLEQAMQNLIPPIWGKRL